MQPFNPHLAHTTRLSSLSQHSPLRQKIRLLNIDRTVPVEHLFGRPLNRGGIGTRGVVYQDVKPRSTREFEEFSVQGQVFQGKLMTENLLVAAPELKFLAHDIATEPRKFIFREGKQ